MKERKKSKGIKRERKRKLRTGGINSRRNESR